jgi:hypothetical protein
MGVSVRSLSFRLKSGPFLVLVLVFVLERNCGLVGLVLG